MCVCVCVCVCVCMHVCMHASMHACMVVCVYDIVCVCMHVCMHVCIHTCLHLSVQERNSLSLCSFSVFAQAARSEPARRVLARYVRGNRNCCRHGGFAVASE